MKALDDSSLNHLTVRQMLPHAACSPHSCGRLSLYSCRTVPLTSQFLSLIHI